jgi:hypothetical protein
LLPRSRKLGLERAYQLRLARRAENYLEERAGRIGDDELSFAAAIASAWRGDEAANAP